MGRKAQTIESLLYSTVPYDGCYLWNRCTDKDGYGVTSIKGVKMPAHRAVMSFLYDVTGQYVLHKCKHRNCVNPDHLYLGTQKQNVQDQIDAGTFVYGSKNGWSKLTEEDIPKIRNSDLTYKQLAAQFNVSPYTIWDILKGRSWKQIK